LFVALALGLGGSSYGTEGTTEGAPTATTFVIGGLRAEPVPAPYSPNVWVEAVFVELDRSLTRELERRAGFKLSPPDGKTILTPEEKERLLAAIAKTPGARVIASLAVLTINGQQTQSEDVEELTFPTEYDTETINIGGSFGGQTNLISGEVFMVTPGNWEKRDVGIILNVTPTVSADGKMISLVLMPEVTDLVRWVNYGNEFYPINQPIFETRNVTTSVYVNDGETIVLGGLITDKTTTYQDKVPLLGSIPFIGRLFRTTAETSSKANLIIFVTARLITATGVELSAQRAVTEQQARHLEKKLRERKEEAGELAPGIGTTGIIE